MRAKKNRCGLWTSLALAGIMALSPGCYGPFRAGRSVYKWNIEVGGDQKWPTEILYFCLYLFGVYPICGFLDLFILNAIEFWSKDKPENGVSVDTQTLEQGDVRVVLERQRTPEGSRVTVQVFERERLVDHSVIITRDDGTGTKTDATGKTLASFTPRPDGSVVMKDSHSGAERVFTREEIAAMVR